MLLSCVVSEVRVFEGLPRRDPSDRLILQHLVEKVDASIVDLITAYEVSEVDALVVVPLNRPEYLVLGHTLPNLLGWRAEQVKDPIELVLFILTLEKLPLQCQLSKNTPHRPNVDWCRILVHF